MELRRLRLIHELARRGTIAAVADALAYSPSSVSVQLAELEREAGVKLLRRVGRNVALTAAGWRLAEHASAALTRDEAIRAELAMLGARAARARAADVRAEPRARPAERDAGAAGRGRARRAGRGRPAGDRAGDRGPALARRRPRGRDRVRPGPGAAPPRCRPPRPDPRGGPARGPAGSPRTTLADVEHEPWAAGQPGSGQAAAVENVCNRLGGYAPDIRHRSDDGLILRALVSSGQAVTLLPALIAAATPGVATHRIPGLYRTIFTAARTAAAQAPAVVAVREAIETAAHAAASGRDDIRLVNGPGPSTLDSR